LFESRESCLASNLEGVAVLHLAFEARGFARGRGVGCDTVAIMRLNLEGGIENEAPDLCTVEDKVQGQVARTRPPNRAHVWA
jgi:hypothetical protein